MVASPFLLDLPTYFVRENAEHFLNFLGQDYLLVVRCIQILYHHLGEGVSLGQLSYVVDWGRGQFNPFNPDGLGTLILRAR